MERLTEDEYEPIHEEMLKDHLEKHRGDLENVLVQLACSECNTILVDILILRDSNKQQSFSCNCPFCDGDSWEVDIEGDTMIKVVPNNVVLSDTDSQPIDGGYKKKPTKFSHRLKLCNT